MSEVYREVDEALAANSQLTRFSHFLSAETKQTFTNYAQLHRWCCDHTDVFWQHFLTWCELPVSGFSNPVIDGETIENAEFFPQLQLNYAECLLKPLADADDNAPAVIHCDESGQRQDTSRAELRRASLAIAASLQSKGMQAGDRCVAITSNSEKGIAACLGSVALGMAWSSVAPDLGTQAVIDRFKQLEPRVLFADFSYTNHGRTRSLTEHIASVLAAIPTLQHVVILNAGQPADTLVADLSSRGLLPEAVQCHQYDTFTSHQPLQIEDLPRLPFNQPLFILFSSGTTGAPKCIVHGAGGTLLEHLKEHRLHTDLGAADTLFFATSAGWMMWNWQLSALASGSTVVLYDGSPSFPDSNALLDVLEREAVTVFGTSPAYIQFLIETATSPKARVQLSKLRAIQSTGSVLHDAHFDWVRDHFKHVPIHSISGGTDIIGCFVLGNPWLPVMRGESQCVSLGLDVRVHRDGELHDTGIGELVCVNPFPSRPIGIWGDNSGERFHESYFAEYAGIWTHGDQFELSENGSARILGRSDGIMKIRGIRIGPSEIYNVVLQMPPIEQAMAVQQHAPREPGGERIVLLLVLQEGQLLERDFILKIKRAIAKGVSTVHVPAVVVQVSSLPQTHNGKFSERAARDMVNGLSPPNQSALKNPDSLAEIAAAVPAPIG